MRVEDLKPNPKNPRTITPAKLEQLKRAMLEFGDLSGVVYNRRSKQLVGGHQRIENMKGAEVTVTRTYPKPTKAGTVAVGYVKFRGERFNYREVEWDRPREMAANIAANKGAGEWDLPQLGEWMRELGSFDVDLDISLTMFEETDLHLVRQHMRANPDSFEEGSEEDQGRLDEKKKVECPECSHVFTP